MCGIAGIVKWNDDPIDPKVLKAMTDRIAHRGPDGEGHWLNEEKNAGFGHRRLSIIDLSDKGIQPMHYLDQRYTIVFNGEIYNYLEIRKTLTENGYHFFSDTDTEVLLALYDFKREAGVLELDGMFAFVIWDKIEKSVFCARDRFGEKPFYYRNNNDDFIFASEIKALLVADTSIAADKDILQEYLLNGKKIEDTQTCFKKVVPLAPATTMYIKNGKIIFNKYWDIALGSTLHFSHPQEAIEEFERLFITSLTRRLRSDVPYGSSLSGGLDSSTVVGFINQIAGGDFKTFSARFQGPKDEGKWISEVTEQCKVRNFTVYPEPEKMLDELKEMIYHHEYPVGSSSIYAQWCVMKLVKEHNVKVLLDGQGADEYLAGYDELKYFAIWELYRKGNIAAFLRERRLFNRNYGHHGSVGWLFLADPVLSMMGKKRAVFANGYSLKEQLKYYIQNNLGELLRYADRNSMAHGVEVRLPFLSHELVQFVFNLPLELIYHNGRTKYILREAARKILPDAIYNRTDKIGFAPPQKDWMRTSKVMEQTRYAESFLINAGLIKSNDAFRNLVSAEFLKLYSGK